MKKRIKRICLPILIFGLICFVNMPVRAAQNLPDLDKSGSISITMKNTDTGEIVSDGSLALYQVADAVEDDGDFSFRFTDEFSNCGLSLEDIQSEKLSSGLAVYAERKGLRQTIQSVGSDGTVSFTGMKTGLYLIVQKSAAEGYHDVSPFLVSIPMQSGDKWVYEVDASPKVELTDVQSPAQPETPTQSETPTQQRSPGASSSGSVGAKLPQTGQLNWPVPVLAVAGILLYAFGWRMNNTKKKNEYE